LSGLCSTGKVFKLDNSAGTTPFYARVNNSITLGANTWAFSTYARGSGSFSFDVNAGTWTPGGTSPAVTSVYQRLVSIGASSVSSNQYRVSVTGGSVVYFILMQAEQGAFPTSVIPNTGTSITRNADAVSMTGTNFTSWYNASAGTLSVSATGYNAATVAQGGVAPTAVSLYAIAATSPYASIAIVRRDAATLNSPTGYILSDTGTIGADIQQNTISWVGATVNAAIAWDGSTNAAFTANGLTVGTDASYTLPTSDSLQIGRWGSEAVTGYWSGHIRKVSFYPQRLTNAELQAITK
jgi:hypothetical protein